MTPTTNPKYILKWIGQVTLVHFTTYIIFGIIFFNLLGYATIYASSEIATYMRSTTDPLVMASPLFQLIRGPIIALALYPFRKIFTDTKQGWALLWGLLLALMIIAPAGAAPGSIEGIIYTKVPLWFHVISLPEVILQTLVFSWLVITWQKRTKG